MLAYDTAPVQRIDRLAHNRDDLRRLAQTPG